MEEYKQQQRDGGHEIENENNQAWTAWSESKETTVYEFKQKTYGIDTWDGRNETTKNCVTVKEVQGTRNMK